MIGTDGETGAGAAQKGAFRLIGFDRSMGVDRDETAVHSTRK
jgi:hypothetical protein